ncbi:MAG: hypothetical protein GY946_25100 [bacterium]|nr:hypothetical protein [bacterium]
MASHAWPSRLLIDILNAMDLGGGVRHTLDVVRNYWKNKHVDPERVLGYAERFGVGAVFERLGFTAEVFGHVGSRWAERFRQSMSAGVSRLDPTGPAHGRIVTRWRLRMNVPGVEL